MVTDLPADLRDLIEGGAAPVTLAEISQRPTVPASPGRRPPARQSAHRMVSNRARLTAVTAATAALACAGAVTAATLAGSPARPAKVFLTAAAVRQMASASQAALATDGRAVISDSYTQNGVLQDYGTDDITFSGHSWNDAFTETLPASGGQPAHTEYAINRIVNGQEYDYIAGRTSALQWYHDTNPAGHPVISVPDPRKAFGVLKPSARFQVIGEQTIGGVRLTELRATSLSHLPYDFAALPDVWPGEHLASLTVWVDRHGVVRKMSATLRGSVVVYGFRLRSLPRSARHVIINGRRAKVQTLWQYLKRHPGAGGTKGRREPQVTRLTVTFLDIGQHEVIRAPAHAIQQYAHG
jgi:hypothetical protein